MLARNNAPSHEGGSALAIVAELDAVGHARFIEIDCATLLARPIESVRSIRLGSPADPRRWLHFSTECARAAGKASLIAVVGVAGSGIDDEPRLQTALPVPLYTIPARYALAHAAHDAPLAAIEFDGPGEAVAIERDGGHGIRRVLRLDIDLRRLFAIEPFVPAAPRDLFTQLADRQYISGARIRADALEPALEALRAMGFADVVCTSRHFGARTAIDFIGTRASRSIRTLGAAERAAGALRCVQRLRQTEGVWADMHDGKPTYVMTAVRPVSYRLEHVNDVFNVLKPSLAEMVGANPALVIVDANVDAIYGSQIRSYSRELLCGADVVVIDAPETLKTFDPVLAITREAMARRLPRNAVIVAVGGGVTLDIAGLAASLYKRGIGYVRIPTTLVGMVDVCAGVKQAVNDGAHKSVLGSFYPPIGGINDLSFLRTLPRRSLACGVAEIIKIALIADAELFRLLEMHLPLLMNSAFQHPLPAALEITARAEFAMLRELAPNLFEHELRRAVDFGHTFSPRIEGHESYRVAHGEAVAVDMLLATAIGVLRGITLPDVFDRLAELCRVAELPLWNPACGLSVLEEGLSDATRHRAGKQNFVVPAGIGRAAFLQDVDAADIEAALAMVHRPASGDGCPRS